MPAPPFRALAILTAKPGLEQALLDFTLDVAPEIRKVDGLRKLEISCSTAHPGQLLLYYWWDSSGHSQRYVASPLYAQIAPHLQRLLQDHQLLLADLVSDG
jgi:quinol monooxygenase YgiN